MLIAYIQMDMYTLLCMKDVLLLHAEAPLYEQNALMLLEFPLLTFLHYCMVFLFYPVYKTHMPFCTERCILSQQTWNPEKVSASPSPLSSLRNRNRLQQCGISAHKHAILTCSLPVLEFFFFLNYFFFVGNILTKKYKNKLSGLDKAQCHISSVPTKIVCVFSSHMKYS